jgi:AcrR family transcriptional regulator
MPAPASPRRRDPQRTRERILAAALVEFSAKGYVGARVDAVARRARVNKRMLYHYFGDKEGLFHEILRGKIVRNLALAAAAPDDPAESLPQWFEAACADPTWIRLLTWEALDTGAGTVVAEDERRKAWREGVEKVRLAQRQRRVAEDLDPEQALLSLLAVTMFPLAFPQVTRLITGLAPTDPRFRRRRADALRRLARQLAPRDDR